MIEKPDAPTLERARQFLTADTAPVASIGAPAAATAMAWALKELCYAAWSSEPQEAVRAADGLRRLRQALQAHPPQAGQTLAEWAEVDALGHWTAGIAHIVRGEMDAALRALQAAAAGFVSLHQPHAAALTLVPQVMALAMLGRHEQAASCAEQAKGALLAQGDRLAASKVTLNLAHLHMESDRYADAAQGFVLARELFDGLGDNEHAVMADIGLADARAALGEFDAATRSCAAASERAGAHGYPVLEAMAQESQALLDLVRGRYRQALAGLEGSRRRYAALQMPQQLAVAHKQLADAYLELRMLPEALAGHGEAIDRFRALEMQVELAWTLVQRGRCLAQSEQVGPAQQDLAESAALFAALDNNTGRAAVALAQAELVLASNPATAQAERALAYANDAAARFQQSGLLERRLRAQLLQAQALLALRQVERAQLLLDDALLKAREHALLPVQLRCHSLRAKAALATNQTDGARTELDQATTLFEALQKTLPGDELRSAYQSDHLWPFQALVGLELQGLEDGRSDAASVLLQVERFRARTLADRVLSERCPDPLAHADPVRNQPATLQAAPHDNADLRARVAWLYRRLKLLEHEAAATSTLTTELRRAEGELLESQRRARLAAGTAWHGPARAAAALDIAALVGALQPEDALVEYGVDGEELFACVVSATGVQVLRRLGGWPQVVAAARALRFQLESLRHGCAPLHGHMALLEQRTQAHLHTLHGLVWQPLARTLAGRRRVMVVAPGVLASLPFAALHDGQRCLAQSLQLACVPSARFALDVLRRPGGAAETVLALGESSRLPHAAQEALAARALLPKGWVFTGPQASMAQLLAHAGGADVIHLACHGQFRADMPLFSALHLADGPLTAHAIESMQLRAATVVLSSCETGLADSRSAGDEMFGLTRSFLVAGAARVVAALWPVDDPTTLRFMSDFYGSMRQGLTAAASLRQAQLAARARHPHPFHWAPFVLHGCW